jgi:hypothetical protein
VKAKVAAKPARGAAKARKGTATRR